MGYELLKKKILIYGCGDKGIKIKKSVQQCCGEIEAYIDARAESLPVFQGKKVFSPEEVCDFDQKNTYVILIAIKNVFQHNEIASTFQNRGYYNIIFKPLSVLNNTTSNIKLLEISAVHEAILDKNIIPRTEIPSIENLSLFEFFDHGVIEENGNELKAYLPGDLFFLRDKQDFGIWKDSNIMCTSPIIDMYIGFRDCTPQYYTNSIDEFLNKHAIPVAINNGMTITADWKDHVIDGRKDVYYSMQTKAILDPFFFIRHCVSVNIRNKGGFYLSSSGKNRVAFLIAERYKYIPTTISRTEYEHFINLPQLNLLKKYITQSNVTCFFAPIPHPYFYLQKVQATNYTEIWLMKIGRILSRYFWKQTGALEFYNVVIYDALSDEGASSRFFALANYMVIRIWDETEKEKLLDCLFYFDTKQFHQKDLDNPDNTIIMLSTKTKNTCSKIAHLTPLFYFIQVWDGADDIVHSITKQGYKSYQLFSTYWGSSLVDGYMCTKEISNINEILLG